MKQFLKFIYHILESIIILFILQLLSGKVCKIDINILMYYSDFVTSTKQSRQATQIEVSLVHNFGFLRVWPVHRLLWQGLFLCIILL